MILIWTIFLFAFPILFYSYSHKDFTPSIYLPILSVISTSVLMIFLETFVKLYVMNVNLYPKEILFLSLDTQDWIVSEDLVENI